MTIRRPAPLTVSSRRFPAPRGFIADLVGLTRDIPLFPVTRSMHLGPLAEARAAAADRIGWAAIVLKAYGRVAAEMPILRTWIVRGIVPRLATSSSSVASVAINRADDGADRLFFGRLPHPDARTLPDIQRFLDRLGTEPIEEVFQRQLQLESLPGPLRRATLWWNMNSCSPKRCTRIGTFSLSTLAGLGASNHGHPTICTTSLSYAPLDTEGRCPVTLICDHRVLDGATAARALARLEQVLCGEMLDELDGLRAFRASPAPADRGDAA